MTASAMYFPGGHQTFIGGFVVTRKCNDGTMISVVDPELEADEARVCDVQEEALSVNCPAGNDRLLRCLGHAKKSVSDAEWDAMRREAVQRFGIADLIPDSKYFKGIQLKK